MNICTKWKTQLPATAFAWAPLVEAIRRNDIDSIDQLHSAFHRGIRFFITRQLGAGELDSNVRECLTHAIAAIRAGDLSDPESLPALILTITKRHIAQRIARQIHERRDGENRATRIEQPTPGSVSPASKTPQRTVRKALREMSLTEREMLVRFYVNSEPEARLCAEFGIRPEEFRDLRRRAQARFIELRQPTLRPGRKGVESQQLNS